MKIGNKLCALKNDQRGLSTVEYTVLLVLIVAAGVGIWNKLGDNVTAKLTKAQKDVETGMK